MSVGISLTGNENVLIVGELASLRKWLVYDAKLTRIWRIFGGDYSELDTNF